MLRGLGPPITKGRRGPPRAEAKEATAVGIAHAQAALAKAAAAAEAARLGVGEKPCEPAYNPKGSDHNASHV